MGYSMLVSKVFLRASIFLFLRKSSVLRCLVCYGALAPDRLLPGRGLDGEPPKSRGHLPLRSPGMGLGGGSSPVEPTRCPMGCLRKALGQSPSGRGWCPSPREALGKARGGCRAEPPEGPRASPLGGGREVARGRGLPRGAEKVPEGMPEEGSGAEPQAGAAGASGKGKSLGKARGGRRGEPRRFLGLLSRRWLGSGLGERAPWGARRGARRDA